MGKGATTKETEMESPVMQLLGKGVPLTLLLDLVDAERMPSKVILRREPVDMTWLAPRSALPRRPASEG